jgi:hypothetical protein
MQCVDEPAFLEWFHTKPEASEVKSWFWSMLAMGGFLF